MDLETSPSATKCSRQGLVISACLAMASVMTFHFYRASATSQSETESLYSVARGLTATSRPASTLQPRPRIAAVGQEQFAAVSRKSSHNPIDPEQYPEDADMALPVLAGMRRTWGVTGTLSLLAFLCGLAGAYASASRRPRHLPQDPYTVSSSSAAPYHLASERPSQSQWAMGAVESANSPALASNFTYDPSRIRNFAIIAHIDHGKSTLADRLLEETKSVEMRKMQAQLLDSMDIERERGITIKLNSARMEYKAKDGETYLLNLIDTPGHVDFTYEVSRSLAACEGALLVVDAAQGIQAQTLANVYLALENDLEIIPVLNKIDLPAADPERVAEEVETIIGLDCQDAVRASAKAGIGITEILEEIVEKVPPPVPKNDAPDAPLRALIFDSYYDQYVGVMISFRVVDGQVKKGDKVRLMASGAEYDVVQLGVTTPERRNVDVLRVGEVGWMACAIKSVEDARVGDTITLASDAKKGLVESLAGYSEAVPMVYCGLFPTDSGDYENLREALGKLRLNDASLVFEPETSSAMGFGFRCGFLGLLHMDVIQERLEREYDLDLVVTAPTVVYRVENKNDPEAEPIVVDNPSKMPDYDRGWQVTEPYVFMEIIAPSDYVGKLMELGTQRRGTLKDMTYVTQNRCNLQFELPLAEVITDFFDEVKSKTSGYASLNYSLIEYRPGDLVRMDVKINQELAPPLACVVHRDAAQSMGRELTKKLKELIPRQMFKVPIQACLGAKVIASNAIPPIRKDVLAKCYGGDISRKKKLLQKQAKGKKRMKMMGKVNVPQEAFMAVINIKKEN
eukprot:CAMPEP_0174292372 /NCGR_PEP_ID=MMETSP0809-20121228/35224_1 /TAXON_ID=73025 ORGANISM="Eutreptiella gymnastica-like, Strain CCMP1594" /NCGR_SAMPLE_ID=MMETSP0809 /ASSEMBLY_ACC=CAM_ASM_000658 /LENGTH=797 /DNA_ID=CAMNT_0015392399 /DNA_START=88 /DNA_END=2481 /DNA_ORIENTATION=+